MAGAHKDQIETIQICRGIAALFILLFHSTVFIRGASPFKIFNQGHSGVVFFFILSGFIIYFTKHTDFGSPDKIIVYLKKRLIRVYPIYWVYLTGTLLVSYTVFILFHKHIVDTTQLNAIDLVKNFALYPYFISPYHTEYVRCPIISQAWTLSLELLFYLTFIMFIINSRLGFLTHVFWFFCIVLYFLKFLTPSSFLLKFLLNPEIILFFMGMSLAYLVLHYGTYLKNFSALFLSAGLAGLLASWILTYSGYIEFYKVHRLFTYGIPYSFIILESFCGKDFLLQRANEVNCFPSVYSWGMPLIQSSLCIL
jgi:exopolysaccharide production protein ExoZ